MDPRPSRRCPDVPAVRGEEVFQARQQERWRCKTLTFSTAQIGTMLPVPWPTTTPLAPCDQGRCTTQIEYTVQEIFESPHCHRCGKVQKGGIHMLFRAFVARWQHLGCLIRSDGSVSRQHLGHWVNFPLGTAWLQHISPPLINCPARECPEW